MRAQRGNPLLEFADLGRPLWEKDPKKLATEEHEKKMAEAAAAMEREAEAVGAIKLGLPPLDQRTFLVTGATSGIGRFTAELLVQEGCTVLMHGKQERLLAHYMKLWRHKYPYASMDGFVADLGRMGDVRELADMIKERHPVLHGVLHNAASIGGDLKGKKKLTFGDLNEETLAVNVMAPFLLTSLLLENVRASGAGRFVFSSSTRMGGGSYLNDLQCERYWTSNHAYSLSKLCDSMIAAELHERFGDAPRLCFHAINPGTCDTQLMRHAASWGKGKLDRRHKQELKRIQHQGTLPNVRTATGSFKALTKNAYQEASGLEVENSPPEVHDASKRAQLWDDLVQLTGASWPDDASENQDESLLELAER